MNYLLLSSSNSGSFGEIALLLGLLAAYTVPFIIIFSILLIMAIYTLILNWKLFNKAGLEGWKAIVPYYNVFLLLDIAMNKKTRNVCFIVFIVATVASPILMWIPIVGWILMPLSICAPIYIMNFALPKVFGKDTTMCVLNIFFPLVILAILAFGSSTYDESQKLVLFQD